MRGNRTRDGKPVNISFSHGLSALIEFSGRLVQVPRVRRREKRKNADGSAVLADNTLRSPRLFQGDEEGEWQAGSYIVRETNALLKAGDIFKESTDSPGT